MNRMTDKDLGQVPPNHNNSPRMSRRDFLTGAVALAAFGVVGCDRAPRIPSEVTTTPDKRDSEAAENGQFMEEFKNTEFADLMQCGIASPRITDDCEWLVLRPIVEPGTEVDKKFYEDGGTNGREIQWSGTYGRRVDLAVVTSAGRLDAQPSALHNLPKEKIEEYNLESGDQIVSITRLVQLLEASGDEQVDIEASLRVRAVQPGAPWEERTVTDPSCGKVEIVASGGMVMVTGYESDI